MHIFSKENQRTFLAWMLGFLAMLLIARVMTEEPRVEYVEVEVPVFKYVETASLVQVSKTINNDAADVARVLYGLADYNLPNSAKRAVIEVILNRVACTYGEFGDTVHDVCSKPNQWQGYVDGGPYLETDYQLAEAVLSDTSGARVTPGMCLFLVCNYGSVTVRPQWDGGNEWTIE